MPAHPQVIGRYRILHPIGRGASGTVYQALQTGPGQLQRTVALKVLAEGAADLWHEARLGGLLRHPHLVDVYEVGSADGHDFCAMEWCEGGALTRWTPLSPRAVVDAGIQAAAALAHAHDQLGIVHLDVKPANLLLARDGVKVGDWGIAREQGIVPVRGTRGFMPPEQRHGEPVDARTDVYALGVTLARLAASDAAAVALTYAPDSAPPTFELASDLPTADATDPLPDWLRPIVERCVAPHPADRWPSMHALAEALGSLEVDGPGLRELLDQGAPAPPEAVALFGRDELLATVEQALAAPRALVTLRGAPGVGKSHVARALAARHTERGLPVLWCDLHGIERLDGALRTLAHQLDTPLPADPTQVVPHLSSVLVLDDVGGDLDRPDDVHAIDAGPDVRWLITSRHALHLPDESVIDVPPLALQACRDLFWDVARRRGVAPSRHDDLDELFERLDRLPLAIELVAGRLGVLDLDEVVANTQLSFLRSGRHGRHATLHTTLSLSWTQLTAPHRRALQALAAFRRPIPMAAIEHVLSPLGDPLQLLAELSERSLLRADGNRFAVLATVRDYVREVGDERRSADEAHGRYLATFGDRVGRARLWSHGGHRRSEQLGALHDDVDRAVVRAVARGDVQTAGACLHAWWSVGALSGPFLRGTELATEVLALPELPAEVRAVATLVCGHAQRLCGALTDAEASLQEALRLAEHHQLFDLGLQAAVALAGALVSLSRSAEAYALLERWTHLAEGRVPPGLLAVAVAQWGAVGGHPDGARAERLEHAAALARSSGHLRPEGMAMQVLGALDHMADRRDAAQRRYRAALRVFERIGDQRFTAIVSSNLAMLLSSMGEHDEAQTVLHTALGAAVRMGDQRQQIVTRIALAVSYLRQERGEPALPHLHTARDQALALGIAQRAAVATAYLARAWALVGEAERAEQALLTVAASEQLHASEVLVTRADVALSLGDHDRCRELLRRCRELAEEEHLAPIAVLEQRLQRRP
jgi:tetratricopeptide (TPR) repeat protein/Mrp family chromosome partitioning ATPase